MKKSKILCLVLATILFCVILLVAGSLVLKWRSSDSEQMELLEVPEQSEMSEQSEPSEASEEAEPAASVAAAGTHAFYQEALSVELLAAMTGNSYPDTDEPLAISRENLAYVHVLHYDFDGNVQEGEIVCNKAIAGDLVEIFEQLYENRYPIEKIRLIDAYGGDDDASMADNNTSCFNYRIVAGTDHLSNHAYGLAIDINPLYNPYITTRGGRTIISPENAGAYVDRSAEFDYKIDEQDLCYKLFMEHGFTWGGSWKNSKDYQHFQKVTKK